MGFWSFDFWNANKKTETSYRLGWVRRRSGSGSGSMSSYLLRMSPTGKRGVVEPSFPMRTADYHPVKGE